MDQTSCENNEVWPAEFPDDVTGERRKTREDVLLDNEHVRNNWKLQTQVEELLAKNAKLEQELKKANEENVQQKQRLDGFKGLLNDKNRIIEQKDLIINEYKANLDKKETALLPPSTAMSSSVIIPESEYSAPISISTVPIVDDTAQPVALNDLIRFYQIVKEALTCTICGQYNTRPVLLGCCHVVCQTCFVAQDESVGRRSTSQERRQGRVCPFCRYPIIGQGFPVLSLRQMAWALRCVISAFIVCEVSRNLSFLRLFSQLMNRKPLDVAVGDPYNVETDEIKHVSALQLSCHAHVNVSVTNFCIFLCC